MKLIYFIVVTLMFNVAAKAQTNDIIRVMIKSGTIWSEFYFESVNFNNEIGRVVDGKMKGPFELHFQNKKTEFINFEISPQSIPVELITDNENPWINIKTYRIKVTEDELTLKPFIKKILFTESNFINICFNRIGIYKEKGKNKEINIYLGSLGLVFGAIESINDCNLGAITFQKNSSTSKSSISLGNGEFSKLVETTDKGNFLLFGPRSTSYASLEFNNTKEANGLICEFNAREFKPQISISSYDNKVSSISLKEANQYLTLTNFENTIPESTIIDLISADMTKEGILKMKTVGNHCFCLNLLEKVNNCIKCDCK